MLTLALTGLHGCGKSSVRSLLQSEHGFRVLDKRAELLKIHEQENTQQPYLDWYRTLYAVQGGAVVMEMVWSRFVQRQGTTAEDLRVVVDSIHNVDEWSCLRKLEPAARLVYVVTSAHLRAARTSTTHLRLDHNRIQYSHRFANHDGLECLFAKADESICNNYTENDLRGDVARLVASLNNDEPPDAE